MKFLTTVLAIVSFILIGCSSNTDISSNDTQDIEQNMVTPTVIPTFTATATDTPFPTGTPAPTATILPEQLGNLPEYNLDDVVVIAGAYVFQITGADVREQIGENVIAPDGKKFLIFDGILYNYSDEDQNFFRTNFELELVTGDTVLPNIERMENLQETDTGYQELNFPRRSSIRLNVLTIPAQGWQETFLVYEIPESFDEITLNFSPANINPPSTIGLWIIENEQEQEFGVYKAYDNGVALYTIDFEFTNRRVQLEELIDEELIEVDNCFGTDSISRTFTFSEQITSSYNIGTEIASVGADVVSSATGLLLGNPIVGQILSNSFTGFFDLEESETIEVTREEQLAASPGTITRYQLSWYRVTVQGTLQMQVGGENFYIPYTITNRLRSDLVSLTPGNCESTEE